MEFLKYRYDFESIDSYYLMKDFLSSYKYDYDSIESYYVLDDEVVHSAFQQYKRELSIQRVSQYISFYAYRPYLSKDQTLEDKITVAEMFRLKGRYVEAFFHFVNYDLCNNFSTVFIAYVNMNDYWDDMEGAFNSFLELYSEVEVPRHYANNYRLVLRAIKENNIDLLAVSKLKTKAFVRKAIIDYSILFKAPQNKKKKTLKWLVFISSLVVFLLSQI